MGLALTSDSEHSQERALGYGNEGFLVISSFNTPTMTLTALWGSGLVNDAEWRPLFARRKKL
ncbi:phosphoribosyltransferase-like protein [Microcella indica]|uniref:phosphoribosyltransferase-like protein n=1 Tax=Microcella indica TaxID=2750620 RepID=UPI003D69DB25